MMNYRVQKQIIVGLTTLIVVFIFSFGALALFGVLQPSKLPMSPFPDSVNGGDEVELKNLEIILEDFFEIEDNIYDVVALIKNPNLEYGASEIRYEFVLRDEYGEELHVGSGKTFILPEQSRYIIISSLRMGEAVGYNRVRSPSAVSFRIVSARWEQLHPFASLGLSLADTTLSRDEESGITRFSGTVRNRTSYNLQDVEAQVVLSSGVDSELIAVGKTNMQTLLRGSDRFFQIIWPYILPTGLRIDTSVESNFLENSNFIREYGTPQKFQEYY